MAGARRKGSVTRAKRSHGYIKAVVINNTAFVYESSVRDVAELTPRTVVQIHFTAKDSLPPASGKYFGNSPSKSGTCGPFKIDGHLGLAPALGCQIKPFCPGQFYIGCG